MRQLLLRPAYMAILVGSVVLGLLAPARGALGQVSPGTGPLPDQVRVSLSQGRDSVSVSANAPFQIVELATGRSVYSGRAWEQVPIAASHGMLHIAEAGAFLAAVSITTPPADTAARVIVLGRQYRGSLVVHIGSDGRLLVVNHVPLEDYLLGVVPREMPASWPVEALRAQAIAARTYAVSQATASRAAGSPFDLLDTADSQVYGGATSEVASTTAAVLSTRGIVITHQGIPISAVYHSSSGGHTENSEIVWTSARAYLRGVPDFDQASGRFNWEKIMTPVEITTILAQAGHQLGRLTAIEPSGARGVSGRTRSVTFRGDRGQVTLRSEEARRLLDLQSTLWEASFAQEGEVVMVTPMAHGQPVVLVGGSAGSPVTATSTVGISYSIGAEGVLHRMTRYSVIHRSVAVAEVRFSGRGWGHGVGMSQYGAMQMAADGHTFAEILAHFYRGTVLEQR